MEQNRAKALLARQLLCETLGVSPPCPAQMIGSMAVVPLPDSEALASPRTSKLSLSFVGVWGSYKTHTVIFDYSVGYMDSPRLI